MTARAAVQINLGYRPKSYFWPMGLETHLLTHIKGASRRAALKRLIDEDRLDEIPDLLATATLPDEVRAAIGRIHPRYMGGEYLPDMMESEVEIARIEIDSTTGDVTSVYARREGALIHYRVVDEYGGDTLSSFRERTSAAPLTLGELVDFVLGAWSLLEVLDANFEGNTERMLDFFRAPSAFYADFDRLLRRRVVDAFPRQVHDEEREE